MAIMVGSFALRLPTSASVASSLAFAKPWRYCAFGGDFSTFGGFERREVKIRKAFLLATSDYGRAIIMSQTRTR